jgi:hypothetical protein
MARRVQNDTYTMPDETPPNVKIYDRPEQKGMSPLVVALIVIAAAVITYFVYRALQPAPAPAGGATQSSTSTTLSVARSTFVFSTVSVRNFPR